MKEAASASPLSLPAARRLGKSISVHVLGHEQETDCWHSTEAEVFEADGSLDTRQSLLTRRFVHAPLEKAFIRRTFSLGRAWVRAMLCFALLYEVGLIVHALACQCGIRWELASRWYLRLFTMGTPFPLVALALAFTYSHHCTPRTLPYAAVVVTLALALAVRLPNSLAAGDLTQVIVPVGGVVHAEIGVLADFKNMLLQHTVVAFGVALVGTLIFDAAGLSPPAMILLNMACLTLHVSLSDRAFSARFSPELSFARTWWQPSLSVVGIQIVQAYVVSALKRRVFLVQLLTASHRIEQLSREKERAEWQQLLTAARQRGLIPLASEPSECELASAARAARDVRIEITALPPLTAEGESDRELHGSAWVSPKAPGGQTACTPRWTTAPSLASSNESDAEVAAHNGEPVKAGPTSSKGPTSNNESDAEIVGHNGEPVDNDLSAGAAKADAMKRACGSLDLVALRREAAGSPMGLTALRNELLAARREVQARRAATHSIAETGVTIGGSVEGAPIFAGPLSVATSATAADLQDAFETDAPPRPSPQESQRPKKREHPLRAFVMALYGQRPPGPMPGQMPGHASVA